MLVTEEEAKTKWCPYSMTTTGEARGEKAVSVTLGTPALNRIGIQSQPETVVIPWGAYCLGSGCMAWRWREGEFEFYFQHPDQAAPSGEGWAQYPLQPTEIPDFNGVMIRWRRVTPTRHGHCGLAGSAG